MFTVGAFTAILAVATWLYYLYGILKRHSSKFPPGPFRWPIIGNAAILAGKNRHPNIAELGKKFGGIYSIQIGVQEAVWITSYKLFREALVNNSWALADRPPELSELSRLRNENAFPGIAASGVDDEAKEIRKFVLVGLRSFGFGKASMQDSILREGENLIDNFRRTKGRPFDPRTALANAAANVISAILLGKSFKADSPEFLKLSTTLTEGVKTVIATQREFAFPFLKWIPTKAKNDYLNSFKVGLDFLHETVDEHLESHAKGSPEDLIDLWLDKSTHGGQDARTFSVDKLPAALLDLFVGGFETTATTFQWMFAMLLHHPETQELIHEEIDREIGAGTQITLDSRDSLVYTEAFILETLRLYPIVPFAVPHMTAEDVSLGPYRLPAGTRVIFHVWSIHHDEELWEDPEAFKPERFVKNGKLSTPDYFLPFSAGRRSCIGEQLARKELFLFFANLMQNFRFAKDPDADLPSLEVKQGIVIYPEPFKIVAHSR